MSTIFTPKHPEKFRGDASAIVSNTKEERDLYAFLDSNVNIVKWSNVSGGRRSIGCWTRYINTSGAIVEKVVSAKTQPPQQKRTGRKTKQGSYTPKNPDKYKGNVAAIRYMSSWELNFHQFLDSNPNVLEWSSEEIKIPYLKPTTGRVHVYLPDYWIRYVTAQGEIVEEIVEVKPDKETRAPRTVGKNKKTQLYEQLTWAVNDAKWKAASLYCKKKGIAFRIVTEKHLFK